LKSKRHAEEISKSYSVPLEDVMLIALNACGIRSDKYSNRVRFQLFFVNSKDKECYFSAMFCNSTSNFTLSENKLYLGSDYIADADNIEIDTCSNSYFRNGGKVLTINTNPGKRCRGCAFCSTYSLSRSDKELNYDIQSARYFCEQLLKQLKIESYSNIERAALCTGCFGHEDILVENLLSLHDSLKLFGFNGSFVYIGSELTSYGAIEYLSKAINNFEMYITLETFTNRDNLLHEEKKKLSLDKAEDIMKFSRTCGVKNNIVTVIGLESHENYIHGIKRFQYVIDRFPIINILQPYSKSMESLRHSEAINISYYLEIRKELEMIFKNHRHRPHPWECYRSLWYTEYNGAKIYEIKI